MFVLRCMFGADFALDTVSCHASLPGAEPMKPGGTWLKPQALPRDR